MESNKQKINIAITGCIHGSMKKMYDDIWNYSIQNKINIDQDDKYYRGSFNESHELKLPAKVKIRYQNREFTTTIVSMTNNYYITKEGNVLYKEDVTIIN